MKPETWIVNGEVGTSSKTIWAVMLDAVMESRKESRVYNVPHDPDDFSRCYKLLLLFPEWQKRLSEVAKVFPRWVGFVREWDKLTEMFETSGYSKEMYDFMQNLEAEGLVAEGWVQTSPGSWSKEVMNDRVAYNEDGKTLDEIVAYNAYVHLEQLSDTVFTLIIENKNRHWHLKVGSRTKRAKVDAWLFEEFIPRRKR